MNNEESRIRFEGGKGETIENAIIIRGAKYDMEATALEFAYLEYEWGVKDRDWKLVRHAHGEFDGRHIDTFDIMLKDGKRRAVHFDCTESFDKWFDNES